MEIINVEFESFAVLLIRINWLILLLSMFLIIGICFIINKIKLLSSSVTIEETNLGIGSNTVKLTCNKKDKEIAYKIWIEMSTRKIGIPFDEDNDVISEVYDSWYDFFKITREHLKELPEAKFAKSEKLIKLTKETLNENMRDHLTKWQARYRKWYANEMLKNNTDDPQTIQKQYPHYEELVKDLICVNNRMIYLMKKMEEIAFK